MVECVMGPGTLISGHVHADWHFGLVARGSFRQRTGARVRSLSPGSIRISPPGNEQCIEVGSSEVRLLIVHPGSGAAPVRGDDRDMEIIARPGLEGLADRLSRCLDSAPSPFGVEEIADELLAMVRREPQRRSTPPDWLLAVRNRIDATFPDVPSVAALAKEAGVTRVHLSRTFSRHFGCSLTAHVQRRRLEEGWKLLRDPDRGLAEIAAEAGFSDQSHFSRAFSMALAIPPGRYRRAERTRLLPVWRSW